MKGPSPKIKLAIESDKPLVSTKYVVMKVELPVDPTSLTATAIKKIRSPEDRTKENLRNPTLLSTPFLSDPLVLSCEDVRTMNPQIRIGKLQTR